MRTFLFRYKTATFKMNGRDAFRAKQAAAALLAISPKQLTLA